MWSIIWLSVIVLLPSVTILAQPQKQIHNKSIKATVYLPDHQTGYYRGTRFDWAGVIPSLEFKGHSYFGQWFEKYEPTLHNAIMGPVDMYQPIGYDQAKVNECFLMIGIGLLKKPVEEKYAFANPYELKHGGQWRVSSTSSKVRCTHLLKDTKYAYRYYKTIELVKDKPELLLTYQIKNTGTQTIETNVFNHNYFVIDGTPTGPDFKVIWPFELGGTPDEGTELLAQPIKNELHFNNVFSLVPREYYQIRDITGYSTTSKDYDIRVENYKTGAGVRITADQPLAKMAFWAIRNTLCPEPFIHLQVRPGETMKWKIKYSFYEIR